MNHLSIKLKPSSLRNESMEADRLTFIVQEIKKWKRHDPRLENKDGFLEHYLHTNYKYYGIIRTKLWLKMYDEAVGRRMSVAELLFDKMKEMYNSSPQRVSVGLGNPDTSKIESNPRERIRNLREIYEKKYQDILRKDGLL